MSAIPCKRPKVTIELVAPQMDGHQVTCHVPGCAWTYPTADGPFKDRVVAPKSDAVQHAKWHRADHRSAVPTITVDHAVDGSRWAASCEHCLRVETKATRSDIDAWVDYHLSTAHGLVSC